MKSNVIFQLKLLMGAVKTGFSFVVKNWLIISILGLGAKFTIYMIQPRVDQSVKHYVRGIYLPDLTTQLGLMEGRMIKRSDSLYIDSTRTAQVATMLLNSLEGSLESISVRTFNNQIASLKFDTVPVFDVSGKQDGYFIMMITPDGRPILFENRTSIK